MKVKMLVSAAGPDVDMLAGQTYEVDDDYAKRMMEADPPQCVPDVDAAPQKETRSK